MKKQLKGYLIEKYNNMTSAYTCHRLLEEAEKQGIDLKMIGIYDMRDENGQLYNGDELLEKRDFVINRFKYGLLKNEINKLGDKQYNNLDALNIYINKYNQVRTLQSDAYIIPKYVCAPLTLDYEKIVSALGSPFVLKGLESSEGKEVFLIENKEDYLKIKESNKGYNEWLFEEYISSSFGRDMRFYSIKGQPLACMERKSQGDFRANVALGAGVREIEATEYMKKAAKDIYEKTGLDFLGIDLLYGETEKPYFCEINVMPGMSGIEHATGVNVAGKVLESIAKDFE